MTETIECEVLARVKLKADTETLPCSRLWIWKGHCESCKYPVIYFESMDLNEGESISIHSSRGEPARTCVVWRDWDGENIREVKVKSGKITEEKVWNR